MLLSESSTVIHSFHVIRDLSCPVSNVKRVPKPSGKEVSIGVFAANNRQKSNGPQYLEV